MKTRHLISGLLVFSLFGFACSNDNSSVPGNPLEARVLPEQIRADASQLVAANNAFALDFYGRIRQPEGNLFFSPFSISAAFAMVYAGAREGTADEISRVFHFPLDQERLHAVYRALLKSLDTGTTMGGYRLDIASRLWGEQTFEFLPEYLGITRGQYGAELAKADFQQNAEGARKEINQWVSDRTEKKIPELFPAGSVNPYTRLVLANAIYFKGKWQDQFDPKLTRDAPFHVTPARDVTVHMMQRTADDLMLGFAAGVHLLELPYRGRDISMLIVLPDSNDLAEIEQRLTPQLLDEWRHDLRTTEAMVFLPRFTMTSEFSLNGVLADLGMPDAFTDRADFSGMDGRRDLLIQAALHKAFVNVNEEGTEAAAATGISVGVTSMPPSFRADHPFLFLIMDNVTGSILFMGRVEDPSAG